MSSRVVSGGVVHTVPMDLRRVLIATPKVLAAWEDLTPVARNEWICWVLWPKKAETRSQHNLVRFRLYACASRSMRIVKKSVPISSEALTQSPLARLVHPQVQMPRT